MMAIGVTVAPHPDERGVAQCCSAMVDIDSRQAISRHSGGTPVFEAVPVLSSADDGAYPMRSSRGRACRYTRGKTASPCGPRAGGWVWLRVPWDPDWRSVDGTPVRKGGPGHLLVWADRGVTELRLVGAGRRGRGGRRRHRRLLC